MTDTHVWGIVSPNYPQTVYLECQYNSNFARDLSVAVQRGLDEATDANHFRDIVLINLINRCDPETARYLQEMPPDCEHTVHVVDTINGLVRLVDSATGAVKVSFNYYDFVARYNK